MAVLASRGPPLFGAARRVVVTGIGLVTPLGVGVELAWQRLLEGKSGVTQLQGDSFSSLPARIAGACGCACTLEFHASQHTFVQNTDTRTCTHPRSHAHR